MLAWLLVCGIGAVHGEMVVFVVGCTEYVLALEPESSEPYDDRRWDGWASVSGTGYTTREQVLIRDSQAPIAWADEDTVETGLWLCPYTGLTFTDASDVDIEHVVAKKEAHVSGAWAWDDTEVDLFVNYLEDPDHLLVVDNGTNRSKGDRDPSEWYDGNGSERYEIIESYRCEYLENWIRIKEVWGLSVDRREAEAIAQGIGRYCGPDCHLAPSASTVQ